MAVECIDGDVEDEEASVAVVVVVVVVEGLYIMSLVVVLLCEGMGDVIL